MAGPSTEYLAEQLDRMRDDIQAARREGVDGWKQLNDTFTTEIREVRERVGEEMVQLRREVGAGMEAIKVDQTLFRENLARLDARTDAAMKRIDRNQDFLDKLLVWAVGLVVTVGGGIFWKAAQAVNRLDEHGRRIEVVENEAKEDRIKSRESFDKLSEGQARLGTSLDRLNENQARLNASFDRLDASQTRLNENQTKLRESLDQFRKTLDDRLPAPVPQPR